MTKRNYTYSLNDITIGLLEDYRARIRPVNTRSKFIERAVKFYSRYLMSKLATGDSDVIKEDNLPK